MSGFRFGAALCAGLAVLGWARGVQAQDDRRAGLFTEARQLPLVSQSVTLQVRAGEARLDVVQSFHNDGPRLAQADFRMPLPEGATVDGFGYWRGGRYLASTLKAREEAEAQHAAAVTAGRVSGLAKSTGSFARFSVVPVAAGATQRVRVQLRLPVATELGRSHVELPVRELLGEVSVPTAADVRIHAEAPIELWRVEGGTPIPIEHHGARLRFAATFQDSVHVWWREKRAALEASASAVALPDGDHGLVLRAFVAAEAFDDQVRPTVAVVDLSFSMRRRQADVELALRRLGPASKVWLVAEAARPGRSLEDALRALDRGELGHTLDPFVLYRALESEGCLQGARCVVVTDAPAAAAHLRGVEVPILALADAEELRHVEGDLPGGAVVHRDADPTARLLASVDALVRPSLRLVGVQAVSGAPVELLDERRSVPAGSVLRLPARYRQLEPVDLQLEVAGQPLPVRVTPQVTRGEERRSARRAVYRAELARMMRRYREAAGDERLDLKEKITALSLREDIPTAFTARQVDDPELSLAALKGGDPHLTLADGPDRSGAVAIYPFGEIRELVRDEARREWVDRFLAPRYWPEHAYRVDVQERFLDGTQDRRHVWYLLDDAIPEVEVAVEEGLFVVRTEDAAGVSSVRALAKGRATALSADAVGWRARLDELPQAFELEIRDRAGNLSRLNVVQAEGGIDVRSVSESTPAAPTLPQAKLRIWAEGDGRYPARWLEGQLEVHTAGSRLRISEPPSELSSLQVDAHLELAEGRHLLGFADGSLLDVRCRETCRARPVEGTRRAHPVRGFAAHRGRVFVAVLGAGLMELEEGRLRRSEVRLPTRFVTDVVSFRGKVYVGTLYDGLWRIVAGRGIKTQFPGDHVDRLEVTGSRLSIVSAGGRFERSGTDRFRRTGDARFPEGQDDLTSIVHHEGRTWVGSFDDGLLFVDGDGDLRRAPYRFPGGVRARHVNALASFGGALFVGTEAGLYRVMGDRVEALGASPVHDLTVDGGEARLLAATGTGLVGVGADGEARVLDTVNAGVAAFSAVAVHAGVVWAGSIDGLWRLGEDGLAPVGSARGFRGGWVTSLHVHEGSLYVGTYAKGVWRASSAGSFSSVAGLEDLWMPFHGLRSLPDGALWIGALGQAPRVLRRGVVMTWPLPARDANDVYALADGSFAVATSDGWVVVREEPASLARR